MCRKQLRTWQARGFRVELYDTPAVREDSQRVIEFELFDDTFDAHKPVLGPIKLPVPVDVEINDDKFLVTLLNWERSDFPAASGRLARWLRTERLAELKKLKERLARITDTG